MTVWITKYALTAGILRREAEKVDEDGYCWVKDGNGLNTRSMFSPKEWHRTPEAATDRAEQMRVDKIKSLQAQIGKLERLSFAHADQSRG